MTAYQKVLCPIDFSKASYKALGVAYNFASQYNAQLVLIHVVSFPAPNTLGYPTEWEAERFAVHEAQRGLQQAIKDRLPSEANARTIVRIGDASSEIEYVAEQENADIIIMSTHGRKGWRRLIYGSVTKDVLHNASVPMLAVSAATSADSRFDQSGEANSYDASIAVLSSESSKSLFKRILCATDLSEFSFGALEAAASLAKTSDAELCVVHVIEPLDPALGIVSAKEFDEARITDASQEIHQAVNSRIGKTENYSVVVKTGNPAAEIIKLAREENFDLIAISTHGCTGWRQLVFGSVAEQIMQSSQQLILLTGGSPETAKESAADDARMVEST